MRLHQRLAGYRRHAHEIRPHEEAGQGPLRRAASTAQSMASFAVLDVNDWLLRRRHGDLPAIWPTAQWPWMAEVAARAPEMRAEVESYLRRRTPPHVAAMSGLDPDDDGWRGSLPGLTGTWRTAGLFTNGRWIDEMADQFPVTAACFRAVPAKANLGFSVLEPRSHIASHTDHNRGALRFQLPLIVPGDPGACRIRIGDVVHEWREGEPLVFDLAVDHEAWNDTDEVRVLLMAEIEAPLPQPARFVNQVAQRAYQRHPSYRHMHSRIARLAQTVDG